MLYKIVELTRIDKGDLVVEIGTGNGNLTKMLQPHCGYLITVEVDKMLYGSVKQILKFPNLTLLNCDALVKKQLNPSILEVISSHKELVPKIVSNPPYNIISPLLEAIISSPITFHEIFLTVQNEVAKRLTASYGQPDYSSLSVFVQSFCEVKILKFIPRQCFTPVPQVDSAFIHIRPFEKFHPHYKKYSKFLKEIFSHRRKNIKNVFNNIFGDKITNSIITGLNLCLSTRPEQLPPRIFKHIYDNFYMLK